MTSDDVNVPGSLLETTLNTRDLGGYRSGITGRELNKWRILRSDVQNYPSERDTGLLKSKNVRTVIDMRSAGEVQKKPSGFFERDGFFYFNIPIEQGRDLPESADRMSETYLSIAESSNIPQVFRTIAAAPDGVIFNCTAGKDRTGVVSAVILGICGVSEEEIIADYMLTKQCNRERFELIRQKYPGIDMNLIIPSERYMAEFISLLKTKYGGFYEYLISIGVTGEEIGKITAKLM